MCNVCDRTFCAVNIKCNGFQRKDISVTNVMKVRYARLVLIVAVLGRHAICLTSKMACPERA